MLPKDAFSSINKGVEELEVVGGPIDGVGVVGIGVVKLFIHIAQTVSVNVGVVGILDPIEIGYPPPRSMTLTVMRFSTVALNSSWATTFRNWKWRCFRSQREPELEGFRSNPEKALSQMRTADGEAPFEGKKYSWTCSTFSLGKADSKAMISAISP